jgi:hypothetical protein
LYHSHFRQNPDVTLENQLEQALLNIENRILPEAGDTTVRKIWQTGPEDAEEREHDCRRWQEQNPEWEYKVILAQARNGVSV